MTEEHKKEAGELTYYMVSLHEKTLFAHGEFYDFFRMYDKKQRQWVIAPMSISQMFHDFRCEEIGAREAAKITGGDLPLQLYADYRDLLSGSK